MQDFGIKREEIFIITKVPSHLNSYDKAKIVIDRSIKNFDLGYLDMILVHHPGTHGLAPNDPANIENRHGTWRAMEEFA